MDRLKKILDVSQIRQADNHAIVESDISSWELMEVAVHAFFEKVMERELWRKRVMIFCGTGNNGGDGLALCRMLRKKGIYCWVVLVEFNEELSSDCKKNLDLLDEVIYLREGDFFPSIDQADVLVDALLGSGLNRAPRGLLQKTIDFINKSEKTVFSIDIPSGLYSDGLTDHSDIVQADYVISFQRPKMSFFLPENGVYVKNWDVVDIGLDEDFIQSMDSSVFWMDKEVERLVVQRNRVSHKGDYGHALLMAGSKSMMGAAVLSARACLRSGVGLLTLNVPGAGYEIAQIAVPEAMCIADPEGDMISLSIKKDKFSALAIGPGLGREKASAIVLEEVLKTVTKPLVIDADALNIMASHPHLLDYLGDHCVLTPHIGEFDRLFGASENSVVRLEKLRMLSQKYKSVIVLKDAYTCIASPDGSLYFNSTGNQGMATAGSGDVLTGIILSLLAQSYKPLEAAIIGVYFHGKAGNAAAEKKGMHALIASDIIENIFIG